MLAQSPQQSRQPNPTVSIDRQLLRQKEKLLQEFQHVQGDMARLAWAARWPNQDIQAALKQLATAVKTNNAWYFGSTVNEMQHGQGLLIYELGSAANQVKQPPLGQAQAAQSVHMGRFYEGEFQNNCKHGYGMEYIAGDIYIGQYINNKPEDPNGIFIWKNGDLYTGGFVNGIKQGTGRWDSGEDYYEGSWKLNRPEGAGKIHTASSDYEGEVKSGYKHGRGLEVFANGDRYQGLYANGKPEGDGTYKWSNGALYRGQFKNGIRYGFGVWSYGTESYEGEYINDKRCGEGVYRWGGGSYYKGQFLNDLRHGAGEMHWSLNSYYRGEWKEGTQWGQGEIWEDGKLVSKGLFEEGRLIDEANKLIKSQASLNHSNTRKNAGKISSVDSNSKKLDGNKSFERRSMPKVPNVESVQRSRYRSQHQKLTQIDEFPRVKGSKRYVAASSVSSHPKNEDKKDGANTNHGELKNSLREPAVVHSGGYFAKKMEQTAETPVKGLMTRQRKLYYSSKKAIGGKKRMPAIEKIAAKSVGVGVGVPDEMNFEPIRWRNFGHLKSHTGDISYHMPQI